MLLDTKAAARGKWLGVLTHYGLSDKQLSGRHTACPICGGKDRFRFDDKEGNGTFYCNHCGAGNGFDLVMRIRHIDFKGALKEVAPLVGQIQITPTKPVKTEYDIQEKLRGIINGATRNVINPYMANRGIQVKPDVWYHPALPYFEDGKRSFHQAILGVVQDKDGNKVAIHRTYLSDFGEKAAVSNPKKLTEAIKPITGGAIRLFKPVGEVLALAEGIETACAAYQQFGIPTWSVINAAMMESFKIPSGITKLIIFGDNDKSFTGQKSAYALANKCGIECEVKIPQEANTDWADILMRGKNV